MGRSDRCHWLRHNRPLCGAMLGTGSISIHHMLAWQAIPGVKIVALANRTRARAEALGRDFGIGDAHVYSDYQELLEREAVDFVDIATAPHIHQEQVLAAAAHGVHVLCQKPFATSLDEGREMAAACEAAGVRCVVNENWRWRRWYRELKELLAQGSVGKPRYARFTSHSDIVLPRVDGTPPPVLIQQPYMAQIPRLIVFEWGIHLIDVMRFLFGDVSRVYARMSRVSDLVQGEDAAVVMLEFRNGVTGILDISWGSRIPEEKLLGRGYLDPFIVEGDAGTIELAPYQGNLMLVTKANGTDRRPTHASISPAEAYQESYLNTQSHFIQALRTGEAAENEVRDNLKTLAITFAAYDSAARNEVVSLGGKDAH